MSRPLHVDMGEQFPLRFFHKDHRDVLTSGLLFLFLPISYLISTGSSVKGFIGQRENYPITLFHGSDSRKQVTLSFGVKKDVFDRRLRTYQRLLGLPVDPEHLRVLEIRVAQS